MKLPLFPEGIESRLGEETSVGPKSMVENGGGLALWHAIKEYSANRALAILRFEVRRATE